jgi:hypothetical protein
MKRARPKCPRCPTLPENTPYALRRVRDSRPEDHAKRPTTYYFGKTEDGEKVWICLDCGGRFTAAGKVLVNDVNVLEDDHYGYRRHSRPGAL